MMGKDEAAPPLMTVRQLAQQGDVTVHVVRNYLRRGLLQAATHTEGGYKLFSASELQRLHFIRAAQQLGFTLAEIGRASSRERVCQSVYISVVPATLKPKNSTNIISTPKLH